MTERDEAKRIENLRAEEARRDEAALRYLLADKNGRWFVYRMLERCHVFSVFSSTADGNANRIIMMEGERRVGVELYENLRRLSVLDESGECAKHRSLAEAEYFSFMARYTNGKEQENGGL